MADELECPAFEARLLDGTWLRVYASGVVTGVEHDVVFNRIPALINLAWAEGFLESGEAK